jgi:putative transposase
MISELERLLGRKTMEVEILEEALDLACSPKLTLRSNFDSGQFPMKVVTDTVGVARSNVAQLKEAERTRRGPRAATVTLSLPPISGAPSMLVPPIATAGSPRFSIASGEPAAFRLSTASGFTSLQAVNRKRVYQLMKKHGLRLLARHAGRWRQREHAGKVATLRYLRWCSDGPELTCWSGELVHVALVFDCHDREVIGWTTTGISGEMIRDRMIVCRSGGSMRRGRPMCPMADREWAHLCRCRHRSGATLASRRSEAWKASEWAEAFVKTFKRDYVRVNPIPGAASAPVTREEWMVDYNEVHPHGYRSPQSQCRTRCVSGLRRAPHDEIST